MPYPLQCTWCKKKPREAVGDLCGVCISLKGLILSIGERDPSKPFVDAPPKARWSMLPWAGLAAVVDMLTATAEIKGDDGSNEPWRSVTPQYHFDAACRHIAAYGAGQRRDPDTGKHPLAHAAGRLLFFLAVDAADTHEVDDE